MREGNRWFACRSPGAGEMPGGERIERRWPEERTRPNGKG